MTLVVDPNPCYECWPGCTQIYTGGHMCEREGGHYGRHRCACGATRSGGAA